MPCSWGFNKLVIKPVDSQFSNTWQLIVTDSCIGLYQLVSYVSSQRFPYRKSSSANRSPTSGSQVVEGERVWRRNPGCFFLAHPSPINLTIIGITSPSVDRTQDLYAYTLILKVSINHIEINIISWVIKCKDQPQPQPAGVICITASTVPYSSRWLLSVYSTSTRWASDSHGLTTDRTTSSHPQSSKNIQRTCQKKTLEKKHGWWTHMGVGQYLLIPFLGDMNIHKSQLFWCELQGYYWFWHTATFFFHDIHHWIFQWLFTNDDLLWFVFVQLVRCSWMALFRYNWDQLGQRNQQHHRFFQREKGYVTQWKYLGKLQHIQETEIPSTRI